MTNAELETEIFRLSLRLNMLEALIENPAPVTEDDMVDTDA